MSYFPKGHRDTGDEVDDFDEYDSTPYGGGYDMNLTYGRPLPPSDEICYPNTTSGSDEFDYDRPQFTSNAEPCAYAEEALDNEYKSYARPKPRPASYEGQQPSEGGNEYDGPKPNYGFQQPSEGGNEHDGPKPNYGFQPGMNRPQGGYGGDSEYGSGYGEGGEYGRKPDSENESGYGRRPEYGNPGSEYGRKNDYEEEPESEYGKRPGSGRKSEYDEPGSEQGSGYGGRPEYEKPSSEYGSGYGRTSESEYGRSEYGVRPESGEEKVSYGRPSYETEEYDKPSYGRSEEEDYRKPSYERRDDDDEEGYGRKKYGDDNSDDEEKPRNKHHYNYDD